MENKTMGRRDFLKVAGAGAAAIAGAMALGMPSEALAFGYDPNISKWYYGSRKQVINLQWNRFRTAKREVFVNVKYRYRYVYGRYESQQISRSAPKYGPWCTVSRYGQ